MVEIGLWLCWKEFVPIWAYQEAEKINTDVHLAFFFPPFLQLGTSPSGMTLSTLMVGLPSNKPLWKCPQRHISCLVCDSKLSRVDNDNKLPQSSSEVSILLSGKFLSDCLTMALLFYVGNSQDSEWLSSFHRVRW